MEVECIKGDGINFFFPSNDCNPFMDKTTGEMSEWAVPAIIQVDRVLGNPLKFQGFKKQFWNPTYRPL